MILFHFPRSPHKFLVTVNQDEKSRIVTLAGLRWKFVGSDASPCCLAPQIVTHLMSHLRSETIFAILYRL